MCILDAGAAAESSGGWLDPSRIPDQEHAAAGVLPGQLGADREPQHLDLSVRDLGVHRDRDPRLTRGVGDHRRDSFVPEVGHRLPLRVDASGEQPLGTGIVVRHHGGERSGPLQVCDPDRPPPDHIGEIHANHRGDGLEQDAGSVHVDPERVPDLAAYAVRRDQIVRPDRPAPAGPGFDRSGCFGRSGCFDRSGRAIPQHRGHPVGIGVEGHELGGIVQPGSQLEGSGTEEFLQLVLVDRAVSARTVTTRVDVGALHHFRHRLVLVGQGFGA